MENLSHLVAHPGALTAGSSMNAGNTTSDNPALAQTAPGSPSVLPVPEAADRPVPDFGGQTDPAPIVDADGSKTGRPGQATASQAGESGFGWTLV